MQTSAPGNSRWVGRVGRLGPRRSAPRLGFTLLELLVVLAIVALSVGMVSLALRDGNATVLEREGVRLAALLEMARAESRVTGTPVQWVPARRQGAPASPAAPAESQTASFRFVGLSAMQALPTHWLDARVNAQVSGAAGVVLGPEAILPAQRVVLVLEDQRLELSSDGLGPFAISSAGASVP